MSTRPQPLTTTRSTLLVAEREIVTQVRTTSFLVSTLVLLVLVVGGIVLSAALGDRLGGGDARVAVVPGSAEVVAALDGAAGANGAAGLDPVDARDADHARDLVRDGEVDAAVLPDDSPDNPLGVTLVARDAAPDQVVAAFTIGPPVELLDPSGTSAQERYLVALAFGAVFVFVATTFSGTIAQNTVLEKQSRIVEILLTTASPRALLAGKILGSTTLAVGQIAVLAAAAVGALALTGQDALLAAVGAPVAWFVAFFLTGFVLLAALFAAAASLVSRAEDAAAVQTPLLGLVILPYVGVLLLSDNDLVMTVLSYVPFSAPIAMPVRLYLGGVAWWEPVLALAVLLASTVVVTLLGARIYQRSVLRTGSRVRLGEALADA
jgi:ABC-2 type transport system permease protein